MNLIGKEKSPLQIVPLANNYLQNVSYETIEGNRSEFCYKTKLSFTRPLIPSVFGAIEINLKDQFVVNWAYGPQVYSPQLQYHLNRDSVYVVFENDAANYSSLNVLILLFSVLTIYLM